MSLKHCTDTKVTVNGNDYYVYDTNVNNTHACRLDHIYTSIKNSTLIF